MSISVCLSVQNPSVLITTVSTASLKATVASSLKWEELISDISYVFLENLETKCTARDFGKIECNTVRKLH